MEIQDFFLKKNVGISSINILNVKYYEKKLTTLRFAETEPTFVGW